jgi:tRNA threonylcarbamoyladenosine biosynthesis protein TsaB
VILAIETATELVGVCLGETRPEAEIWVRGHRRHAESLAPAIRFVLDRTGIDLEALEAVAVDVGPGLFTGIRVGVASAKAFAAALGIGVLGVTSTEALARGAFDTGWQGPVVAVIDARRSQVFAARYTLHPEGGAAQSGPVALFEPGEVARQLLSGGEPHLVVGDGALRYRALFEGEASVVMGSEGLGAPMPHCVLSVANDHLGRAELASDPDTVEPLYLRDADVRINWVEREPSTLPG